MLGLIALLNGLKQNSVQVVNISNDHRWFDKFVHHITSRIRVIRITPCIKIDKPLVVYRLCDSYVMIAYICLKHSVFTQNRDLKVVLGSYDQ